MDETREKIMQAAVELISTKGYKGATTREIAETAGVNEVTLFRHFGTKQALFEAVLNQYSSLPDMLGMIEHRMTGDYRQDLIMLGMMLNTAFEERREILPLILCEAEQINELQSVIASIPERLREYLSRYLREKIEGQEVIPQDPELLAQAFLGMFFSYHISTNMLDSRPASPVQPQQVVETFVDIFVRGTSIDE